MWYAQIIPKISLCLFKTIQLIFSIVHITQIIYYFHSFSYIYGFYSHNFFIIIIVPLFPRLLIILYVKYVIKVPLFF